MTQEQSATAARTALKEQVAHLSAQIDLHAKLSLEQGQTVNRRLESIESIITKLDQLGKDAATLTEMVQRYEAASVGGRAIKWFAALGASLGAIYVVLRDLWA